MNFLENVCCVCLKEISESNQENFVSLDDKDENKISLYEKLINIIPEIDNEDYIQLIINKQICHKCENTLKNLHDFKKMCINNKSIILSNFDRNTNKYKTEDDSIVLKEEICNKNLMNEEDMFLDSNDECNTDVDEYCENNSNKGPWKLNKLTEAILAIEKGEIKNPTLAAKKYNVSKIAIARRLKKDNPKKKHTITIDYEHHKKLNIYLMQISRYFYNLKGDGLKKFFYHFIERNDIFNDYFKSIKIMDKKIETIINQFYDNIEKIVIKNRIPPTNIFNINKFTISYENLMRKRKNYMRTIENETLTSFLAVNSNGDLIPLVSTQKNRNHTRFIYENKTEIFYSKNDDLIFLRYLEIFVNYTNVSRDKIILLIDQQYFNIRIYEFCRDNDIFIICIPFGTSNMLQPINLKLINKIKYNYSLKYENHIGCNNEELTIIKSVDLLSKVSREVLMKDKIIDSFKITGIQPFDRNSVDIDFYASISK